MNEYDGFQCDINYRDVLHDFASGIDIDVILNVYDITLEHFNAILNFAERWF